MLYDHISINVTKPKILNNRSWALILTEILPFLLLGYSRCYSSSSHLLRVKRSNIQSGTKQEI